MSYVDIYKNNTKIYILVFIGIKNYILVALVGGTIAYAIGVSIHNQPAFYTGIVVAALGGIPLLIWCCCVNLCLTEADRDKNDPDWLVRVLAPDKL